MDIEKLIERMNNHLQSLAAYSDPELAHTLEDAATALSTLQAENKKLRAELEQVKVERDAAVALVHEWEEYGRYLSPMGFTVPHNWRND